MWNRVTIIGVGLLGGSLGLALKKRGLAKEVVGCGRFADSLERACKLGAIDTVALDLSDQKCWPSELVIICTPVASVAAIARAVAAQDDQTIITDVGSTKAAICSSLAGMEHFCGSHPMAGSEKSGVEFSDPALFHERLCVITPTSSTSANARETVLRLWDSLGSQTVTMEPMEHDQAVARTSHLPHVLASALAAATDDHLLPLAATGWCDTTRIAAGNVELWQQILMENRLPILGALKEYADSLAIWIDALDVGDSEQLMQLLEVGKQKRDSLGN